MPDKAAEIVHILEDLTGQPKPLPAMPPSGAIALLCELGSGMGYSQFNELLLLLGYDRVTHAFFQFLVDGKTDYDPHSGIKSLDELRGGVGRFCKFALLTFGNVKYAFKIFSRDAQKLRLLLATLQPVDEEIFAARHEPVLPVEPIRGEDTFYLGYIVQRELKLRLQTNPADEEAQAAEAKRETIVAIGIRNQDAYLASDHLDVYVATSMRERHEYMAISELTTAIFSEPSLAGLHLRWFDPTQAYCADRIDKGLAEALMLKRAKCTIYLAQESDTLGKDSELASTLAQGKPVIAFVPQVDEDYVARLLANLKIAYPQRSEMALMLDQLRVFEPDAAWRDPEVRSWLNHPDEVDPRLLHERLTSRIKAHYERRASTLREDHPLGIQVNLSTGVANGVLVVRTVAQCAELVRRVLTGNLEFALDYAYREGRRYVLLREVISGSVFRVMTGDAMLTNTFWNFYLEPAG